MSTRDRTTLRDSSPEQIEAMQHVARECSDMESALGPTRLHRIPPPVAHSTFDASALCLWLIVVGAALLAAWGALRLGMWALA